MLSKLQDSYLTIRRERARRADGTPHPRVPVDSVIFHANNRGGAYVNVWAAHTIADRWVDCSAVNAQSERGFRDESLEADQLSYKPPPCHQDEARRHAGLAGLSAYMSRTEYQL